MVSFLVVGDGGPAKATLDAVLAAGQTASLMTTSDAAPGALGDFARAHGIEVADARDALVGPVASVTARDHDWLVSANSTLVLPRSLLDLFPGRAVNCHPGLLPEYAGLHTHQWAIRNGAREFGATLHRMEACVDTGAVLAQERFPIEPNDTGLTLFIKCMRAGASLLAAFVRDAAAGSAPAGAPQDLRYRRLYRARDATDGRIDWAWSAEQIADFVRAGNYEPFASPTYTATLDVTGGTPLEILRAEAVGTTALPTAPPGRVVDIGDEGPLVVCGDGRAVRLSRARRARQILTQADWRDVTAAIPDRTLRGRDAGKPAQRAAGRY